MLFLVEDGDLLGTRYLNGDMYKMNSIPLIYNMYEYEYEDRYSFMRMGTRCLNPMIFMRIGMRCLNPMRIPH